MKAKEMIDYLEVSWAEAQRKKTFSKVMKGVLKAMKDQPLKERKKAALVIGRNEKYSSEFTQHAARMLDIKIKYQEKLELCK